jgi:uncharacterized Tic20 family protein
VSTPPPPPPAYAAAPPARHTGTAAWALGFLAYIPIPFVAQIVTGLVMAAVYPNHKRRGPVAQANARNAANWGLTYAVLTVVFIGLSILFAALITNGGTTTASADVGVLPLVPILLWMLLGLVHIVVVIVGTVQASKGAVFRFPLAIRFIAEEPPRTV